MRHPAREGQNPRPGGSRDALPVPRLKTETAARHRKGHGKKALDYVALRFGLVQPPHPRFVAREVGPTTIGALVAALAVLWIVARPAGESTRSYAGQLLGAEAILLLSIGLVLISTLPWVEEWFDGIDRAAIWHRRLAITGLVLLAPHVLLSANPHSTALGGPLGAIGAIGLVALALWAILPRWQSVVPSPLRGVVIAARDAPVARDVRRLFGGYDRWRALHRTTGLFVAAGFAHGLLDGTPFDSAVLRWSYVAIGAIGVGFYVYRELLARFFMSLHDYEVDAVREIEKGLVEVAMRPIGRAVHFVPGQFAMVYLEAKDGWHRHPFTISSAPQERVVRVTVKALGDYTSRLQELIEPGMPAVIGGPHGRFSHRRGTDHQVWIAGGVGVAPFLSWLRALDGDLTPRVDFFYTAVGEAAFAQEIRDIADDYASLHAHLIDTSIEGRLTADRVLAAADTDPRKLSVFMCGPAGMLSSFQTDLRLAGVPARRIHREHFDWR
jgi:predicted ferric reductase